MKKTGFLICIICMIIFSVNCHNDKATGTNAFTFTVVQDSTDFKGLPALQSFVFATADSGKYWLIFGGRTNGFHGFSSNKQNFPFKKANQFIYVYNTVAHVLDSLSVKLLPVALREQYTSSNMQNRQVDSFLYVSGGYGEIHKGKPDSAWVTYNILSRVHVKKMINAVLTHDSVALNKSVVYDSNKIVQATGGELFKMPDGKFYLVLGHIFTGKYSDPNAIQQYLDSVHVFTLTETDTSIKINTASFQYISDNLPDSTTQFRRRDLVVAPHVLPEGLGYGISIYGGVFTYSPGCPSCPSNTGGNPFRNPIYITGPAPFYIIDTNFKQFSNIYSAPNLQMFDGKNLQMYTTIFGGLGDTLVVNGDSAAFTKFIQTINRDYTKLKTNAIYNPTGIPDYVGAEGIFVPASNIALYKNNNLGIMDYNQIPSGSNQLLGYIYGGIHSDSTQWNNTPSPRINVTHASDRVLKVYINKN